MRDIYNPPPAPVAWKAPQPELPAISGSDIAWLLALCGALAVVSAVAWVAEPMLGLGVTIGGLFVILESWFSGLTFLHRHPSERPTHRGLIFLAALMPWIIGLAFAAAMMWGLFYLSDLATG